MMCAICRRDARGFGFAPSFIRIDAPAVKLCSRGCQDITRKLSGMIDPNKHENNALAQACLSGGAYVETIGKTDLGSWTEQEWAALIDVVITSFQDFLREAYADDPPF